MIYVFLADGFEEIEALAPVDLLRRAGVAVQTVGITGKTVTGSHNISVTADILPEEVVLNEAVQAVVLPGGMPGAKNLDADETVSRAIAFAAEKGKLLCTICAAPFLLGKRGLLQGKKAICYPGFEKDLTGAEISEKSVCRDGSIITAKGMGVATEFGLKIVEALSGEKTAAELRATIQSV